MLVIGSANLSEKVEVMEWSSHQYLAFERERTRPIRDLVTAIQGIDVRIAVDIGCGPGNSTEVLAARFPGATITGLDSSPDMIAAARERLPHIRFDIGDITAWEAAGPYDVILANAVLQWLPGHAALLPRLISELSPGGALAVQIPDNLDEPAHRLMREIAADGPCAGKLTSSGRAQRENPEWYYKLLRAHCTEVDIWRTVYYHALPDAEAIVDWFKGTGLRPFLAPLDDDEQAAYLDRYRAAVARAYPALSDGTVILPFPHLFMIGKR